MCRSMTIGAPGAQGTSIGCIDFVDAIYVSCTLDPSSTNHPRGVNGVMSTPRTGTTSPSTLGSWPDTRAFPLNQGF